MALTEQVALTSMYRDNIVGTTMRKGVREIMYNKNGVIILIVKGKEMARESISW